MSKSTSTLEIIKCKRLTASSNSTHVVTLIAKDNDIETKFVVHKDFACHYCPIFRAAFNSDFLEGQTQTYTLSDTTATTMRFLVEWIYTQSLTITQFENKKSDRTETMTLVQLWVLADKLLIPKLQNFVMRKLVQLRDEVSFSAIFSVDYVWQNTLAGSPLHLLFLHQCVCHVKG